MMSTPVLCADGVTRFALGQWQAYLSAADGDREETGRRLLEVPRELREAVANHCTSVRVSHWVREVIACESLAARRAMIQACPEGIRPAVQDQVQVLFSLREAKRQAQAAQRG